MNWDGEDRQGSDGELEVKFHPDSKIRELGVVLAWIGLNYYVRPSRSFLDLRTTPKPRLKGRVKK